MASLKCTLLVLLVLHTAQSCRYFCKNHQTNTYECCDAGGDDANPEKDGSNPEENGSNPGNDGSNPVENGSNPGNDGSNPEENGSNPGNDGSNPGVNGSDPEENGSNDGSNPGGNNANPGEDGSNPDGDSSNPGPNPTNPDDSDEGDETDPDFGDEVRRVVVTEHGPEDGAKYNTSSSCRYYCAYGGSVYCCDDGSLTMPGDHDPHSGRCPTEHEQLCKDDAIFLSLKANKVGKTLSGTPALRQAGSESVRCASDGYCAPDEKCCTSVCHKRHVCLKALHAHKEKE